MSRRRDEEFAVGSDSFLDVIANIVGILIILIVFAGLRAGNGPIDLSIQPPPVAPKNVELPAPVVAEPQAAPEPSPELLQQLHALEAEQSQLDSRATSLAAEFNSARAQYANAQQRLGEKQQELSAESQKVADLQSKFVEVRDARAAALTELARLRAELTGLKAVPPNAQKIEHRVTPISHMVHGPELHFQVIGGRVSFIPLDELIDRLRAQIMRRREWLMQHNSHEGQVGPVQGWVMHYLVERQAPSLVDEFRGGQGSVRIGVSEWQVKPESNNNGESIAEAFKPGSGFQRALLGGDVQATVTFWVYPDSFPAYRELQKYVYSAGFRVAARPLPFGVPIAGSPSGSRSAGQ